MVAHHQMAVMMATMALPRVEPPELRGLLQAIITSQGTEIGQMGQWYRAWYGTTVPVAVGMAPVRVGLASWFQ
jgi:uncharacterized protein (DUF305 family)